MGLLNYGKRQRARREHLRCLEIKKPRLDSWCVVSDSGHRLCRPLDSLPRLPWHSWSRECWKKGQKLWLMQTYRETFLPSKFQTIRLNYRDQIFVQLITPGYNVSNNRIGLKCRYPSKIITNQTLCIPANYRCRRYHDPSFPIEALFRFIQSYRSRPTITSFTFHFSANHTDAS